MPNIGNVSPWDQSDWPASCGERSTSWLLPLLELVLVWPSRSRLLGEEDLLLELSFGRNSVMTTVTLLTVTSLCMAELRSTFFSRGRALRFFAEPPPTPPPTALLSDLFRSLPEEDSLSRRGLAGAVNCGLNTCGTN